MKVEESVHHILSPSGADRWTNCLGSLAACKDIPVTRSSAAAALGTCKHAVSEMILNGGAKPEIGSSISADGFDFRIDDEFMEHVMVYVNYVRSRPGRKLYEVKLDCSHIYGVAGQGGTGDCVHLDFVLREIEIVDAKFGYIPVGAKHKQLRIYGAAALALFSLEADWDTVRTTIVQPQDVSEPVKTHVYTRVEIEQFIEQLRPVAQLAFKLYQNPPVNLLQHLTPSDEACAWCPIAGPCAVRTDRFANMFAVVKQQEPEPTLISNKRIGELKLQFADMLEWIAAVENEASTRALQGHEIGGHKLIYGRKGNRAWKAEDEKTNCDIADVLGMMLNEAQTWQPRKLRSPTDIQEQLKAIGAPELYETIKPYITQSEARLKLVPLTAKGDAVTVAAPVDMFGVVTK
jgi:hypothetical protein